MLSAFCFNLEQSKILSSGNGLTLTQASPGLYVSEVQMFENIVEEGEIVRNKQFPKVFSTFSGNFLSFSSNLKLSSANSFSLEESKICCLGTG